MSKKQKLTLEVVQKYLRQEGRKYNGYVVFECPLCKTEGHDRHRHNLVFREKKGNLLVCMRKPKNNHGQKIYEEIIENEKGGNNDILQ